MDEIKTAAYSMKETDLLKGLRGWKESLWKRREWLEKEKILFRTWNVTKRPDIKWKRGGNITIVQKQRKERNICGRCAWYGWGGERMTLTCLIIRFNQMS